MDCFASLAMTAEIMRATFSLVIARLGRANQHFRDANGVLAQGRDDGEGEPTRKNHGVASAVTDRVVDADAENFMNTSKDAQASSGAMVLTWNN
jgi:hypothetical protein